MSEKDLRVFVSYTGEDLLAHADAAIESINAAGCVPVQYRFWENAPGQDVVRRCLAEVRGCQLLVVLVAHRYGWIPQCEDPSNEDRIHADGQKSMVRLEVEQAERDGLPVVPFVLERTQLWPPDWIDGRGDAGKHEALAGFVKFLETPRGRRQMVGRFTDPRSIGSLVKESVSRWQRERLDPVARHLAAVHEACSRVDLVGFGHDREVHLPIEQVYVPLQLASRVERALPVGDVPVGDMPDGDVELEAHRGETESPSLELKDVLARIATQAVPAAVLLGVPGCGKSTALRRLAWECSNPDRRARLPGLAPETVPILLRLRTLRGKTLPPDWRAFVQQECSKWLGFEVSFDALAAQPILWLLDGLDEIPDAAFRLAFLRWMLAELAPERFARGDRLVLSSRRDGWPADDASLAGIAEMEVRLFDEEQRRTFVERWYREVERAEGGSEEKASQHATELNTVLDGGDFRGLLLAQVVSNPLLLTILCLLHRDEIELPRRRAALYDRCLSVLLTHWRKPLRGARRPIDEVVACEVLKKLAWWLAEENAAAARSEDWYARAGAVLGTLADRTRVERDGEAFLTRLAEESGLIQEASAGQKSFLHLSFQEYLAARFAIDSGQAKELVAHFGAEAWREITLLALSGAPLSFATEFFRELLSGGTWREQRSLLEFAVQESLYLPAEPFLDAIAVGNEEDRRTLEQLVESRLGKVPQRGSRATQRQPTAEKATREPRVGDERTHEKSGIKLLWIPPGEFDMGSESGSSPKRPVRRVRITTGFWLARHPVTNGEYGRFLEKTGHAPPQFWTQREFNRPNQPVVGVSWDDVQDYCSWAGFVLPSEAWWEYACRGSRGPTRTKYWSGDSEDELAEVGWYAGNSDGKLQPVAQKKPNPFGLFDVHGNVWEWCEDTWHESYKGAPKGEKAWVDKASGYRVIRGGSFRSSAEFARSACRSWTPRSNRWLDLGFRPAQAVTP